MTQKEYKEKYSTQIFADGLLEIQKNLREKTLHEKYTDEELWRMKIGKHKNNKHLSYKKYKKQKEKEAKQEYLRKNNYEQYVKQVVKKRKKTNLKKYGFPFAQSAEKVKEKQKATILQRYGSYSDLSRKGVETRIKNGTFNWYPIYSLDSQELFIELEKIYISDEIYFATNGTKEKSNEYKIITEKCVRSLDFYDKTKNKCIEYDEEYHNKKEQQELDRIREKEIKKKIKNIKILRIKRKEYQTKKEKTIKKCVKFLQK
jgi:hypothetical protein